VIVIFRPYSDKIDGHPLRLGNELSRVWERNVRMTYVFNGKLNNLTSVKAMLCSRTLAGSDEDDEVVRLRDEGRDILDSGLVKYAAVVDMFRRSQSLVQGLKIEACNYFAAFLQIMRLFIHESC
jgi:hypothetical protein